MALLSQLRYENFLTLNWDLGVNQQMLWTTAHGQLLYESGDYELYGVHSFLQIHSTYIAIPLSIVYEALPGAATLFVLQSAAFAASIFPLYLIARKTLQSRLLSFSLIGIYLISFGVIAALLYDFHWEAFIPVEFLSLYYLVERRRYAWSLIPALLGVLTLEVFSFLIIAVVCLGLYERIARLGYWWNPLVRDRHVRMLAALLLFATVSYAAVRVMQYDIVPVLISQPAPPLSGSQNPAVLFYTTATLATLPQSAIYWLLLLAAFGMLPLLAPRFLILSGPWIVASVFIYPGFSNNFGNQYALIAIAPLAIAAVNGLAWLERRGSTTHRGSLTSVLFLSTSAMLVGFAVVDRGSRQLLSGIVGPAAWFLLLLPLLGLLLILPWNRNRTQIPIGRRERGFQLSPSKSAPQWFRRVPYGLLASMVVLSVAMSPLNPTNSNGTQYPGYYGFHWTENPVAGQMNQVLGHIPGNATILASDNLFPYVANDPNAYPVTWYQITPGNPPYFPFSPSHLPQFVLADSSQINLLPASMQPILWNSSVYGMPAFVYYGPYPGSIYLFQLGYTGPPDDILLSPAPSNQYFTGANLSVGASGYVEHSNTAKFGILIESHQAQNSSGRGNSIWYGPYLGFLPGNYTVTINITGGNAMNSSPADTPVLFLNSGDASAGVTFYSSSVNISELVSSPWVNLQFKISVQAPYPLVEFRGYLDYTNGVPNGYVALNYVEVSPRPG